MNGIIFHDNTVHIGCSAEFIFEPELNSSPTPAIAQFTTGETAYAEILEVKTAKVTVRIGEYLNNKGIKVTEKVWRMFYDQSSESWNIVGTI